MTRLALSKEDGAARDWLGRWFARNGFAQSVDVIGNQFGTLSVAGANAPVVMVGSHLDSQPNGGRFDGALGVVSACEAVLAVAEKLKAEKAGAASQILLQPVTVSLGKNEYSAAVEHLDMFRACAFDVEDFGNATLIVRSAPQYLDAAEVADSITEMADHIAQGKNDVFTEKMDWFYHNVACRSAIKAGNKSSAQELMAIVKTLEENPQITRGAQTRICHG